MRSKILTPLFVLAGLFIGFTAQAQLPYTFDAGLYGCPDGSSNYIVPSSTEIDGTDYDSLYQSYCTSTGTFTYTVENEDFVAGHSYDIILHFAEIFHGPGNANPTGGVGSRIFSVELEGIRILDSMDIYAAVGPNNALVYRKMVQLDADAKLDLKFIGHEGDPILNAIEILPIGHAIHFPPYVNLFDAPGFSLPVVWGAFEASTTAADQVNLLWTTPEISQSMFFEVEMNVGEEGFNGIGMVEADDSQTAYGFQTQALSAGSYQFRLRFVGIDGHEQLSEIREVEILPSSHTSFTLFPNPVEAHETLTIRSTQAGIMQVRVMDLRGNQVQDFQTIGAERGVEGEVSLGALSSGIYLLHIVQNGTQQFHKVSIR
ncbi:MAG: malectin domain-containing carbohydrate-binding protein [Bacteroidota bacterium]